MPAAQYFKTPDGRDLTVTERFDVKSPTLQKGDGQPVKVRWSRLHPKHAITVLAPKHYIEQLIAEAKLVTSAHIRHAFNKLEKNGNPKARGDGRVRVFMWNEPQVRTGPVDYDPNLKPNKVAIDKLISADVSPSGDAMRLRFRFQFEPNDLKLNVYPQNLTSSMPKWDLPIGEGYSFRGPKEFVRKHYASLNGRLDQDSKFKMRAKMLEHEDDAEIIGMIIWKEVVDQ